MVKVEELRRTIVEDDRVVGYHKDEAENTNLVLKNSKETTETQLATRLQELQCTYTSTIDHDGDDSSDDEDVESTVSEFNYKAFNGKTNYFPQLAHVIGLKLYWSSEVNKLYYKEKNILLNGNTASFNKDKFEESIIDNFDLFINCLFKHDEFSKFNKKYLDYFKRKFLQQCAIQIEETKKSLVDIFQKNIRLILKLSTTRASSTIPLDLYEPINKFFNFFKKFMLSLLIDYDDKIFSISSRSLAHELDEVESKKILVKVKQYLIDIGIIGKTGCFVKKSQRNNIYQKNITKETNKFKLEILRQVNRLQSSNTLPIPFLGDNKISFLEKYFEQSIEDWVRSKLLLKSPAQVSISERVSTLTTVYKIQSLNPLFDKSFFGDLEKKFRSAIKQKIDNMTLADFYKKFRLNFIPNYLLDRTSLSNNFTFTNNEPLHVITFVRLSNRSQTRLIQQKKEYAAQLKCSFTPEVMFRKMEFPCINSSALERQELTNAGVRKDVVPNMKNYPGIYLELEKIRKLYNFDDRKMAIWIRQIIKNEPIDELRTLKKPLNKEICQFLANFTYVFFISEPTRNPACWITHQIILDLIIGQHYTWKHFLTETTKDDVTYEPYMPMAIKHAVRGARYLSENYWNRKIQVRRYCYPGGSGSESENSAKSAHISKVENFIITEWFRLCVKKHPQSVEEAAKILNESVRTWYGVHMHLIQIDQLSLLTRCDWLIAYRNDKEKKELKLVLDNSAISTLGWEPLDIIVRYCKGGKI